MDPVDYALDHGDAIAQAWWRQAYSDWRSGRFDASLACAQEAARVRSMQNRWLVWPQWESLVGQVGKTLLAGYTFSRQRGVGEATVHVLNEALPAGGVTRMATRWIRSDPGAGKHHVVILDDTSSIPTALQQAIAKRAGTVWQPHPRLSWTQRVLWLAETLHTHASRVVLHTDPADVLCTAALSPRGGPPVLWVNHTAHSFATGISVADIVVNVRGSALEHYWSRHYRGAARIATLPIPVEDADTRCDPARQMIRQAWGLPPDATVVLSVGSRFKFDPLEEPDFLQTWSTILQDAPGTVLCMVGFPPDRRWQKAQQQWGTRLRVLGPVHPEPLAQLMRAADVYAEGFALGTTTALLESVNNGLPALLAPRPFGPPYGSDGVAIDDTWPRPDSVQAYVQQALLWLNEPRIRQQHAQHMQASVQAHHTGDGWQRYLANAYARLPLIHRPNVLLPVRATDRCVHERWTRFRSVWGTPPHQYLSESILRGWRQGVQLPSRVIDELISQRRPGLLHRRRLEETALRVLSRLPAHTPSDLRSVILRGCRWISGEPTGHRAGAYDEYRQMSDLHIGQAP